MSILSNAAGAVAIYIFGQMAYNTATIHDKPKAPEVGTTTRLPSGELQIVTRSYSESDTTGYYNGATVKVVDSKTATACDYFVSRHSRPPLPTLLHGDFSDVVGTGSKQECTKLTPAQVACFNDASSKGKVVTEFETSDSFLITTHIGVSKRLRDLCVA